MAREQVLERGGGLAGAQILKVLQIPDDRFEELLVLAREMRVKWRGPVVEVEGIVSLKTQQQSADRFVGVVHRPADVQLDSGLGQLGDDVSGIGDRAGQPAKFAHHEHVTGPAGGPRFAQAARARVVPVSPWST